MYCVNRDTRVIGTKKDEVNALESMPELAGREMCLLQRPHNQVGAARRRRIIIIIELS